MYIAGHFLAGADMHIADAQLINGNAALDQLAGTLRVAYDQKDVLAGGCLVNDCNGLVQRKEPDAAAGTFRGGSHQALLQRIGSCQIICHNNKVDTL